MKNKKKAIKAPTKKQIQQWKEKAEKWDKLDSQLGSFYFDDNGDEIDDVEGPDLVDVGEAAAIAFGYL